MTNKFKRKCLQKFYVSSKQEKEFNETGRRRLMYRSNRSFNMLPAPPGIPRAFDTFAVPGRREFDYRSLPGCGEFVPNALGVGNLNCTLDFM